LHAGLTWPRVARAPEARGGGCACAPPLRERMLDRLAEIERRYEELERLVADPTVIANRREFARLAKERSQLEETVACWRERRRVARDLDEHRALLREKDAELRELARSELPALEARLAALDATLKHLLLPKDPNDERNTVLEIRAGTGGDEASLFAAELFRMYSRYAERHGWRIEALSSSPTGLGGFKEVIALVQGKGAYSRLKFEGGVHRVQRVPVTETQGRIHTSAVTVAGLLERAKHEQQSEIAASRRAMLGSGDRSEKIRTYNFPQSRITDHRANLTLHTLERVLDGELDAIIDALTTRHQAEALEAAG